MSCPHFHPGRARADGADWRTPACLFPVVFYCPGLRPAPILFLRPPCSGILGLTRAVAPGLKTEWTCSSCPGAGLLQPGHHLHPEARTGGPAHHATLPLPSKSGIKSICILAPLICGWQGRSGGLPWHCGVRPAPGLSWWVTSQAMQSMRATKASHVCPSFPARLALSNTKASNKRCFI